MSEPGFSHSLHWHGRLLPCRLHGYTGLAGTGAEALPLSATASEFRGTHCSRRPPFTLHCSCTGGLARPLRTWKSRAVRPSEISLPGTEALEVARPAQSHWANLGQSRTSSLVSWCPGQELWFYYSSVFLMVRGQALTSTPREKPQMEAQKNFLPPNPRWQSPGLPWLNWTTKENTFGMPNFPCSSLPPGLSPPNLLSVVSTAIPQTEALFTPPPDSWLSMAVPSRLAHEITMRTLCQMHLLPVPLHGVCPG